MDGFPDVVAKCVVSSSGLGWLSSIMSVLEYNEESSIVRFVLFPSWWDDISCWFWLAESSLTALVPKSSASVELASWRTGNVDDCSVVSWCSTSADSLKDRVGPCVVWFDDGSSRLGVEPLSWSLDKRPGVCNFPEWKLLSSGITVSDCKSLEFLAVSSLFVSTLLVTLLASSSVSFVSSLWSASSFLILS